MDGFPLEHWYGNLGLGKGHSLDYAGEFEYREAATADLLTWGEFCKLPYWERVRVVAKQRARKIIAALTEH